MTLTITITAQGRMELPAAGLVQDGRYAAVHRALVSQGYVLRRVARVRRVRSGLQLRLVWRRVRSGDCAVVTRTVYPGDVLHDALACSLGAVRA